MSALRKLATLRAMSRADRRMVVEAVAWLAVARLAVIVVPFRHLAAWLERTSPLERTSGGAEAVETVRREVRRAVTAAARNVPWNAVCLPQAMAAKAMLSRRQCSSTFHLGAGFDPSGKLIAHAWLTSGGEVVIGADGMPEVTPLAQFG